MTQNKLIHLIYSFSILQSNRREADLCMVRELYLWTTYLQNDYIGTHETYDFHFQTGPPQEIRNSMLLFRPFDKYVWAFLVASVVTVSVALILIDKAHAT